MRNTFALLLLLTAAAARAAVFTAPVVDLDNRLTGTAASLAIWSNAKVQVANNSEINITFPAGFNMGSVNPSSCQCIFMKFTNAASGSFTPNEVTVTAGHLSGQTVEVHLPGTFYPGPWYVRFDPSAGITNPTQAGTTNLMLEDPSLATLVSRSFRILYSLTDTDPPQGVISGIVTDAAGVPVSGAMVVASTGTVSSMPDLAFGPGLSTTAAMGAGEEMLVTLTGQNGSYSLTAPYTTAGTSYNVQANFTVRTVSGLATYATSSQAVQVSSGNLAVSQNLAQQSQLLTTPLN